MRTKFLLFFSLLTFGALNAQDTIKTLIITEARLDDARRSYCEIANVGTTTINLAQFEFGIIGAWSTAYNPAPNGYFMLPDRDLAPGETFLIAGVYDWAPEMYLLAPEDYDPFLTKREMWTLADVQIHFRESPTNAPSDSVTPFFSIMDTWNGRDCFYLRQHISETDSAVVDQVNGIWDNTAGNGRSSDRPVDVAGFTNATREATLVRKFSVKQGNLNFEEGRGQDLTESEWMPIPHQANNTWAGNVRRLFWTAKAHGDYNLDETTLIPKDDAIQILWEENKIILPWGVRRDDSVMFQFQYQPGFAWAYEYAANHEDSVYFSAQTDDTITIYACGNDLDMVRFAIEVAPPTEDANKVIPKRAYNANGFFAGVADPVYTVSDGDPEMDYISSVRFDGIPFNTRTDTLLKYLELPSNASYEFVWVDGQERTDLKNGDILRITSANGTEKDYLVKVDHYRPSHNAYLSSITWPDIPEDYRGYYGWLGDTIPNFVTTKYNYKVSVPADVDGIPALVGKNEDLNGKHSVDRATNLFGGVQDATVTFTSVAEDDTTIRTYAVQLVKEKADSLVQPYTPDPFISQFTFRDQWASSMLEVVNPGNKPLDLSHYMLAWGYLATASDAIASNAAADNWRTRYGKYIPGRKWVDSLTWQTTPGIAIEDVAVNPIVLPGDVFCMGEILSTGQLAPRNVIMVNGIRHWFASLQLDVDFATGRNPWGERVNGGSAVTSWLGGNYYLFRIDNDSVRDGLKPANDPNDFTLIDQFGDGTTGNKVIGGVNIDQIQSFVRKAEIYHGNPVPGGTFGTDAATSEWKMFNRAYYDARNVGWPEDILFINEDLGSHFMNEYTGYKSTIASMVYKITQGYTKEGVRGIAANTTVTGFEANIIKADTGQDLLYKSGVDGAVKVADDIIVTGDTLYVTSADSTNMTTYILEVSDLSDDAVLTSETLTIDHDATTGTISGFEYGVTLKSIYDAVQAPAGATFIVMNTDSAYVPFKMLNFDTTYVNVLVSNNILFEVIAENGKNRIVYTLVPTGSESDAFVTSSVYGVDNSVVKYVPQGTTTPGFLANLIPAPGAYLKVVDKLGFERTTGDILGDDKLIVTSADSSNVKYYLIEMNGLQNVKYAYVESEVYVVDQIEYAISGRDVTFETSVVAFLANLTPAPGATFVLLDADDNEKTDGFLATGDKVVVTSQDLVKQNTYAVNVHTAVEKPVENAVSVYPNPSTGRFTISGLKSGYRINVSNIIGVLVQQKNVSSETDYVNIESERNGFYFITVVNADNKVVGRYKVVKE